jgi:hypothetical protein
MPSRTLVALFALALAGCAMPKAARMERPAALQSLPEERLEGVGGSRNGTWKLAGIEGRFERSADQLGLFDTVTRDRASVRVTWGGSGELTCRAAQVDATVGIVQAAVRPFAMDCVARGLRGSTATAAAGAPASEGRLRLEGRAGGTAGTQQERNGRWQAGDTVLEVRSVHRLEGTPIPSTAPFGYVLSRGGTPVAAVEVDGARPRLWRPPAGAPLHEDSTVVLVALALLWDPAR